METPKCTSLRANQAVVSAASLRRCSAAATVKGAWMPPRIGAITVVSGSACAIHWHDEAGAIVDTGPGRTWLGPHVGVDHPKDYGRQRMSFGRDGREPGLRSGRP